MAESRTNYSLKLSFANSSVYRPIKLFTLRKSFYGHGS